MPEISNAACISLPTCPNLARCTRFLGAHSVQHFVYRVPPGQKNPSFSKTYSRSFDSQLISAYSRVYVLCLIMSSV
ncbi:hypothetical protein Ancab_003853 [Ancistrocladus abbreviatus]